MKLFHALLALTLSLAATADTCNTPLVANYANQLAGASNAFARAAAVTYGYAQLSSDSDAVSREAQRMVASYQSGATCYQLQSAFDFLDRYYGPLQSGYGAAQSYYPSPLMAQYWAAVDAAHLGVRNALYTPPPPPPLPTTVTVDCGSSKYKYRLCPVAGRVVGGQVVQILSHSACLLGQSYGFLPNGVWVDRGCHGIFVLNVQ